MIHGLAVLLACQLAGEVLAKTFSLPVPGPVIGIVVLVAGLLVWRLTGRGDAIADDRLSIATVSDGFLRHLALLFVPAGVGVVALAPQLGPHALPLLVAILVSTAVTLVVTVLVFVAVRRLTGGRAP